MPKKIQLTKGKTAIVDDGDYDLISTYKWYAEIRFGIWYAKGRVDGKMVFMHRFLLNAPSSLVVDHIDGDGLNNCRSNIRLATPSQNSMNQRVAVSNKTGYKGVHFVGTMGKYRATIRVGGKSIHLGYFENREHAAMSYNAAARQYFGEFAQLNRV